MTEAVWQLPNPHVTVFERRREAGPSIMVRDHHGAVIVAMSKKLRVPLGPLEAEAKALEEVIAFA